MEQGWMERACLLNDYFPFLVQGEGRRSSSFGLDIINKSWGFLAIGLKWLVHKLHVPHSNSGN